MPRANPWMGPFPIAFLASVLAGWAGASTEGKFLKSLVPGAGIEPARGQAPRDFKSLASAYFATQAQIIMLTSNLPQGQPLGQPDLFFGTASQDFPRSQWLVRKRHQKGLSRMPPLNPSSMRLLRQVEEGIPGHVPDPHLEVQVGPLALAAVAHSAYGLPLPELCMV